MSTLTPQMKNGCTMQYDFRSDGSTMSMMIFSHHLAREVQNDKIRFADHIKAFDLFQILKIG